MVNILIIIVQMNNVICTKNTQEVSIMNVFSELQKESQTMHAGKSAGFLTLKLHLISRSSFFIQLSSN
ncbi:hypothetical protein EXN66_Car012079 [Channa argus]|uniref:Uncharacterized protein n=1 Tax=Channa argus TaxID=215402 RepID=A0A6G1Q1C1_CHAAH|nr:hypothetical protein EXN66_Car012079 [Channa argus]